MVSKDIVVQNEVGLHARPATFFIQKANEFQSSIWVVKDETKVMQKVYSAFYLWVSQEVHLLLLLLMDVMRLRRLTAWINLYHRILLKCYNINPPYITEVFFS